MNAAEFGIIVAGAFVLGFFTGWWVRR